MSETKETTTNPVVEVVKRLNYQYNNTGYAMGDPRPLGSGKLYSVKFKGSDDVWHENYVFERGSDRRAYWSLHDLILDSNTNLVPTFRDPDYLKLVVVCGLTVLLIIAVILIVAFEQENKSLQVLTGLLGLTLGYLVGKGDTKKS
jgi:hypothetical protein